MERSMLDIAYDYIGEKPAGVKFEELFAVVCTQKGITDDKKASVIGRFYADLSLDGRFTLRDDNVWDLRERYKYDNVHIDVQNIENEINQTDLDDIDKADNAEYDKSVQGGIAYYDENAESSNIEPNVKDEDDSDSGVGL